MNLPSEIFKDLGSGIIHCHRRLDQDYVVRYKHRSFEGCIATVLLFVIVGKVMMQKSDQGGGRICQLVKLSAAMMSRGSGRRVGYECVRFV